MLGDWLIRKGKITEEQLARGLQDQAFFGERLGNSLIKLGFIDEDTLGEYLSDVSGTRYASARRLESIPPEVIATVPAKLAAKYRIVPIAIEGRRLHLAMRDPKDLIALDEIAFLTGLPIEPFVATEFRIVRAIERYYQITLRARTIPVAGGSQEPARPQAGARPRLATPPKEPQPEIGLDGLPLDAETSDLDEPFVKPHSVPPPTEQGPEEPLPVSLDAWRASPPDPAPQTPDRSREVAAPREAPAAAVREMPAPALAAVAARAAVAPAPAAAPEPPTIETVSKRLREAETRDEVFDAVLDFTTSQFRRAALFVVQQERVLGWSGRGGGLQPLRIRNVTVPLDLPSLFVFFRSGGDYYYGPVPDLPANAKFYLDLGCPPPARVLLVPLSLLGKPAVILYADNGPEASFSPDIRQYRRLLQKAALALEVLILKNKIMMI
jgi:type II secretion system (T2SS) protein E